ncbi:hypothetical protein ACF064_32130 [Streptomyces sp. NPDC015492]|uniref:hypothetical protein n=1 Tax=Streptomyces sp. NPDC015492 TaxID=3364958 RepID=UPI0036FEF239
MTTLYTTPSGIGRHRQAEPRREESVPQSSAPMPVAAPLPAPVPRPVAPQAPAPMPVAAPLPAPVPRAVAPQAPAAQPPVPVPVPVPVQGPAPAAHLPADPPIYKAVLSLWASQGRTLPGHRDQEWARLAAGPVWADRTVRVSGTLVRPGDGAMTARRI